MKAFLGDQCKEIEENNRMGKTRDLFKKIRDTKGTFHAKMGSIKDRNSMDLTEAEMHWFEHPLTLPFFGIGMKTDLFQSCGDWKKLLLIKKRCPFHYRGLECKNRKSRNTWSNRQIWPWNMD